MASRLRRSKKANLRGWGSALAASYSHRCASLNSRGHFHLLLGDQELAVIIQSGSGSFGASVAVHAHFNQTIKIPTGLLVDGERDFEWFDQIGSTSHGNSPDSVAVISRKNSL